MLNVAQTGHTEHKKHTSEKRVLGVKSSGTYSDCFVLKADGWEVLIAFQPADHFAVFWRSYFLKIIVTSHVTT